MTHAQARAEAQQLADKAHEHAHEHAQAHAQARMEAAAQADQLMQATRHGARTLLPAAAACNHSSPGTASYWTWTATIF